MKRRKEGKNERQGERERDGEQKEKIKKVSERARLRVENALRDLSSVAVLW